MGHVGQKDAFGLVGRVSRILGFGKLPGALSDA